MLDVIATAEVAVQRATGALLSSQRLYDLEAHRVAQVMLAGHQVSDRGSAYKRCAENVARDKATLERAQAHLAVVTSAREVRP